MAVPSVIVLDGYDGSGKTTLAKILAQKLGGRYIKSFDNSLGRLIWSLFADREFDLADLVSRIACRKNQETNRDAFCLVFDRHWEKVDTPMEVHLEQQMRFKILGKNKVCPKSTRPPGPPTTASQRYAHYYKWRVGLAEQTRIIIG